MNFFIIPKTLDTIELYWLLIQEDVNQKNSEETVPEPEDKRVIDEEIIFRLFPYQ